MECDSDEFGLFFKIIIRIKKINYKILLSLKD